MLIGYAGSTGRVRPKAALPAASPWAFFEHIDEARNELSAVRTQVAGRRLGLSIRNSRAAERRN